MVQAQGLYSLSSESESAGKLFTPYASQDGVSALTTFNQTMPSGASVNGGIAPIIASASPSFGNPDPTDPNAPPATKTNNQVTPTLICADGTQIDATGKCDDGSTPTSPLRACGDGSIPNGSNVCLDGSNAKLSAPPQTCSDGSTPAKGQCADGTAPTYTYSAPETPTTNASSDSSGQTTGQPANNW